MVLWASSLHAQTLQSNLYGTNGQVVCCFKRSTLYHRGSFKYIGTNKGVAAPLTSRPACRTLFFRKSTTDILKALTQKCRRSLLTVGGLHWRCIYIRWFDSANSYRLTYVRIRHSIKVQIQMRTAVFGHLPSPARRSM